VFGQWALGTAPLGEPEELVTASPAPATATVWFTTESSNVTLLVTQTGEEIEG